MSTLRKLSADEARLVRHLLTHGDEPGRAYLDQLERLEVTSWRCDCGCASLEFAVDGQIRPDDASFEPLGHFAFESEAAQPCGIFVFARSGFLGGIEVFSMGDEPPRVLPVPEILTKVLDEPPPAATSAT